MKMQLEQLLQQDPYSMDKEEKSEMLSDNLNHLSHYYTVQLLIEQLNLHSDNLNLKPEYKYLFVNM